MTDAASTRPSVPPPATFHLPPRQVETLSGRMRATLVQVGVIPVTSVRVVLGAGSSDVPEGQTWLDRLVHEYLREGTEARDAMEFAAALAAIGGRLDIDADEHTTVLGTQVPSEHAPAAVAMLAELARTPRFPDDAAARLLADLRRSLDLARAQPQWIAHAAFRRALYGSHPYGRVLPEPAELDNLTTAAVREYWEGRTGARRAHLMAAGRFDADAVLAAANEGFLDWREGPPPSQAPPSPRAERAVHLVDRPGAEQSTLQIGLPVPDPVHEDYVALEVTNALLGGSFHSRITMNIREDKGYTYSPRSSISSRPGDAYWAESADVTTAVTGAAMAEIFGEIDRLRAEAPPEDELAGIQNYVSGAFVMRQSTPGAILDHLEFLDLHGLDASYSSTYLQRVRAVTPSTVQRIAREYLRPEAMAIVVAGDRQAIEGQVAPFGPTEG